MIDLAPGQKVGLSVANPVLLAAGAAGCGEAIWPELEFKRLGGVVVGPVTLSSRAGLPMPRHAAQPAGLLLEAGSQNRGAHATLRAFAPLWARLGLPVIVQLADAQPAALARCAALFARAEGVAGIEWLAPAAADAAAVRRGVEAVRRAAEAPLWVKFGLEQAVICAPAAVEAGAGGIVIGRAPVGAALMQGSDHAAPWLLQGALYGPSHFAPMLHALARVAALNLDAALIACGGIHTIAQAHAALAAGARALQLDTVAWIEPAFPALLAASLAV